MKEILGRTQRLSRRMSPGSFENLEARTSSSIDWIHSSMLPAATKSKMSRVS